VFSNFSTREIVTASVRLLVVLGLITLVALPLLGRAKDRGGEHRVRAGDTLTKIAQHYGVRVQNLAAANRISTNATLRLGQILVIPESGVVYVKPGDTIGSIARTYHTTVGELLEVNRLKATSIIRPGQELLLPGHQKVSNASRKKWGAPKQRGLVQAVRIGGPGGTLKMRLLDNSGRAKAEARRRLSNLMRHRQTGAKRLPDPRLLQNLTRVSDFFGGRRILIISGYRKPGGYTRDTSRHTRGQALDIRIPGVPNTNLRDYCRALPRTGCGYYPRSTFVHMDVRASSAYWVDWSRPGEAPSYARPGERAPDRRSSAVARNDDEADDVGSSGTAESPGG
jgi:LysM repeat protein